MGIVIDQMEHSMALQFPWLLYRKQRKKYKIAVLVLVHLIHDVDKKAPTDIKIDHKVRRGEKDIEKIHDEADKFVEADFEAAEATEFSEKKEWQLLKKLEDKLIAAGSEVPKRDMRKLFEQLIAVLQEYENEDRDLYKVLAAGIKEADSENENFMSQVLQVFKSGNISRLAAVALRMEVRRMWKAYKEMRSDKTHIETDLAVLKKGKDKEAVVKRLETHFSAFVTNIKDVVSNSYKILKRDFLAVLLLLHYIDMDENHVRDYMKQYVFPKKPGEEHIVNMEEVKKHLKEHLQTLAQGLRRLISDAEEAKKKATVLARA